MVLSSPAALAKAATSSEEEAAAVAASSEVQGLTQMYYLEEEAEKKAVLSAAERAVVAGDGVVERKGSSLFSLGSDRAQAAAVAGAAPSLPQEAAVPVFAASDASPSSSKIDLLEKERVFDDLARPQGMSQMFFLDREEEEAAAAALPAVAGRPSFLSDKLGVPGEVVQGLRQVKQNKPTNSFFFVFFHKSSYLHLDAGWNEFFCGVFNAGFVLYQRQILVLHVFVPSVKLKGFELITLPTIK